MKLKSRAKMILAGVVAAVTLAGVPMTVYAGYAPANRPTYQCITPTNCPGADHVVFNSFTNASNYGDERAFFDGKDASDTSANGYKDKVTVSNGQRLTLRVYIHNNANPAAIGEAAATAKNTHMEVLLPLNKQASSFAAASVTADNANPGTVSDTVDFVGAQPFTVTFDRNEPVQMTYRPNGTGNYVTNTIPGAAFVSDSIMTANFGDWKGCFEYAALVTMTVKIQMDVTPPPVIYRCDALTITANVNRSVKISTFTTTATNGATFKNAVVDWGDNSTPLTSASPVGQTHQYGQDGTYTITATAHFTVDGQDVTAGGPQCKQQVTFTPTKPPVVTPPTTPTTPAAPTKLVNTGPGSIAGIFAAVTAAGALVHRKILSRRLGEEV